jgi:hypothetical protein
VIPTAAPAGAPVNWFVVGVAAGLSLIAVVGVALLCAAPRRPSPPVEVAAAPDPAEVAPEPAPVSAPPVASVPAPGTEEPASPALPEAGDGQAGG